MGRGEKKKKKRRQRAFREDSPLSDFQTSKKKASSLFSSSDTFVPPLHARRHGPSDAQKAPTAHEQLYVHMHYLPPSPIASHCHFRPINVHFIWKVALEKLGGTDRGVLSSRELQQFCVKTNSSLSAPSSVMRSQFKVNPSASTLDCGAHTCMFPTFLPLFTRWFPFLYRSAFLLLCSPQGYLFLPISVFASALCRDAGQVAACFSVYKAHSWSPHTQLPWTAALAVVSVITSTLVRLGGYSKWVRPGSISGDNCNCQSLLLLIDT